MTSSLDRSQEEEVAGLLMEMLDETGYTPEEFIPGLMLAAKLLASVNANENVLDEAVQLLDEEE